LFEEVQWVNILIILKNTIPMANGIGHHTTSITRLETAINHMSMLLEKIVTRDEPNLDAIEAQPQQESHHTGHQSTNYNDNTIEID
jgi:hypothetical protein